jgi:uncharacterized protein (TIGR00730 family)
LGDSRTRPIVAVFGSSTLQEREPEYEQVRQLGEALARRGFAVMTGGYDGAMAAASRGAHDAGGHVIGVTVEMFESRGPVNPWVGERVHSSDLFERLRYLAHEADAFVAVTGSIGTLTELFLAWTLVAVAARPRAPLVLMGAHWHAWLEQHRAPGFVPAHLFRWVEIADTPAEAAALVAAGLAREAAGAPQVRS